MNQVFQFGAFLGVRRTMYFGSGMIGLQVGVPFQENSCALKVNSGRVKH